jgi:hypothetical protein
MEKNMKKLDYSLVMSAIKVADQDFTAEHGCGVHYELWDTALEEAVKEYNRENVTDFDPVEARHQYIEQQEAKVAAYVSTSTEDLKNLTTEEGKAILSNANHKISLTA